MIELRDRPLPEGIVQHGVDGRRRNAQARSDIPVDRQRELRRGGLLVARQIDELRQFPSAFCTIGAHLLSSVKSTSVSVYWYCVAVRRPPMLMSCTGCMNSCTPGTAAHGLTEPRHDLSNRCALGFRLQGDEDAPLVLGRGCAARTDIGADRCNRRVLQDHADHLLLYRGHARGRNVLRRLGYAEDQPGVLLREKPFGMTMNSQPVSGNGRQHHHQRDEAMAQRHDQGPIIDRQQRVEAPFQGTRQSALLLRAAHAAAAARPSSASVSAIRTRKRRWRPSR